MCNRDVKFGAFFRYARAEGAEFIATGHYVSGAKDQRYFLWNVPKEALSSTVFPLAGYEKDAVRAKARSLGLPVADKPDSQGICFLGPVSVEEFLSHELPSAPGKAFDEQGKEVGTHAGALFATLGERVALTGAPGPWFVHAKRMEDNALVVSHQPRPAESEYRTRVPFARANWLADAKEATSAQLRYRGARMPGRVEGGAFVPAKPLAEWAAPGQSIVFWKHDALIGGGIISP
jgi:tRNA-specific 2-thiouridylase